LLDYLIETLSPGEFRFQRLEIVTECSNLGHPKNWMVLNDDKKKDFVLKVKHLSLVNAHLTAKCTFEKSAQASDPIVPYPIIQSLSLDNSILSLN